MGMRSLAVLLCLALLLLPGCQKSEEPIGAEEAPPSSGMTAPPSPTAAEAVNEETDGVSLSVAETRKNACVFEIRNDADRPFSITKDYALERRENDAWLPCQRLRASGLGVFSYEIPAGAAGRFVFDWSYPYGALPPGRYRLTVWGNLGDPIWHQGSLTAEFELRGDESAIAPAPAPAPGPDWAEASLTMVTPHKWRLRLWVEPERRLRWEDDITLFRKEGADYVPVSAAYRLPEERHITSRGELTWNLNLAAAYGELPPGEYLLRKRLLDLSAWPEERDRDWDLIAPEKLTLLDVPFTLAGTLPDVSRETDPWDRLLYVPSLPVEERVGVRGEDPSPAGIRLLLENTGSEELMLGWNWYLYFREGEEWFPVQTKIFGYYNLGMPLAPGETKTQALSFEDGWGLLPPGVYRLVQELNDGKLIFFEFAIE